MVPIIRTIFEFLAQKVDGLRPKKLKTIKFIESGLENWAKIKWTTNKVDSNDKNR